LTPMLPLAIPHGDEQSRRNLFLAFKAASILIVKLIADTKELIHLLADTEEPVEPPADTKELADKKKKPSEIPLTSRLFPNITKIRAFPALLPPSDIGFTLKARDNDEVSYRQLYLAQRDKAEEMIYVKFADRYSSDLHTFCADKGLAPKLLGFERLTGGLFAIAMVKVDTVELKDIKSFSELDEWKNEIRKLVHSFHQAGLVHGDLRLPNFIFTKAEPRKMMLVDFDWGGQADEVFFPPGHLCSDLLVVDDRLDRPITIEHDLRVLARAFKELDARVMEYTGGKTGMDAD